MRWLLGVLAMRVRLKSVMSCEGESAEEVRFILRMRRLMTENLGRCGREGDFLELVDPPLLDSTIAPGEPDGGDSVGILKQGVVQGSPQSSLRGEFLSSSASSIMVMRVAMFLTASSTGTSSEAKATLEGSWSGKDQRVLVTTSTTIPPVQRDRRSDPPSDPFGTKVGPTSEEMEELGGALESCEEPFIRVIQTSSSIGGSEEGYLGNKGNTQQDQQQESPLLPSNSFEAPSMSRTHILISLCNPVVMLFKKSQVLDHHDQSCFLELFLSFCKITAFCKGYEIIRNTKVSLVLADPEEKRINDGGSGMRLQVVVIWVCLLFQIRGCTRKRNDEPFTMTDGGCPREIMDVALMVMAQTEKKMRIY
ncbi:hypothetical protein LR48_Vigan07g068800 [Vigna angularis]|uniref:Uncharacterized protein n=1 Tax=Phaseolus angularis TaxID=3914 RepID=A0A0L9UWT1_PHAAN|nr:hypothetical protein LR48_Vigan07g068800 [Vigna angularis]